jgi:hypothetical protein
MTRFAQTPMPAAETALSAAPASDPHLPYAPLRVMTFNVLYHGARNAAGDWPTRRQLVEEVLERWHPCVAGFQEATELQLEQLIHDHPEYAVVPGPVSGKPACPRGYGAANACRTWASGVLSSTGATSSGSPCRARSGCRTLPTNQGACCPGRGCRAW